MLTAILNSDRTPDSVAALIVLAPIVTVIFAVLVLASAVAK